VVSVVAVIIGARRLAQAHANLVSIFGRLGQPEKARQHYRAAVEVDPNLPEIHYNFGILLLSQRRLNDAAAAFQRALEIKPNYRLARFHLAHLLLQRRQNDEAIYQLEQTLTPEDAQTPRFMYSLAGAYAQSGDLPSARRYLQEARQRAASFGQAELVAEIDRALRSIRPAADLAGPNFTLFQPCAHGGRLRNRRRRQFVHAA